jgi:beta-carotene 3-hydroxylase
VIDEVFAAVVAFVVMEPATCAAHRWVMHGAGWLLHRSHHVAGVGRWEANDAFPLMFAALTIAMMAVGSGVRSLHLLVAVGVGVTAYGAAYAFVHDVIIHRRIFSGLRAGRTLARLRDAHGLHHRFGGAPYGMLWPVIPAELQHRARPQATPQV